MGQESIWQKSSLEYSKIWIKTDHTADCLPCPFLQIIRKNKMAFRVLSKPVSDIIHMDKATLAAIVRSIADQNLNESITSELRVIDLVSGNHFS